MDGESGDSVAKICSQASMCDLQSVLFEDIGKFTVSFEKYLGEEKGRCGRIWLSDMEGFGEETDKNHREEISKLAKKLFWNIGYDGEGSISIRNF